MRDREIREMGKGEAARRRAKRRRERQTPREWLAPVTERFWALSARQRYIGMVAAAFVILVLCIAVLLPSLAARGQNAARATQTAEAAILMTVTARVPTPTPQPTPTPPPPEMACAYQALYGDALGTVFDGFGVSTFQYPAPYFYYEQCSLDGSPAVCTSKKPISNIDLIEPDWWIEIPGVDQKHCEENDGLWVEIEE
jgi:hypothetical protein